MFNRLYLPFFLVLFLCVFSNGALFASMPLPELPDVVIFNPPEPEPEHLDIVIPLNPSESSIVLPSEIVEMDFTDALVGVGSVITSGLLVSLCVVVAIYAVRLVWKNIRLFR